MISQNGTLTTKNKLVLIKQKQTRNLLALENTAIMCVGW
jgi:hypothetical protein